MISRFSSSCPVPPFLNSRSLPSSMLQRNNHPTPFLCRHIKRLTRLVKTKRTNVGVDHAQVERSEVEVAVSKSNKHGVVDRWVTVVHLAGWLVGVTAVGASGDQWSIGEVKLRHPCGELRCASGGGSDVAVVGADKKAGLLPLKEHSLAWKREWL